MGDILSNLLKEIRARVLDMYQGQHISNHQHLRSELWRGGERGARVVEMYQGKHHQQPPTHLKRCGGCTHQGFGDGSHMPAQWPTTQLSGRLHDPPSCSNDRAHAEYSKPAVREEKLK